jgi:hypothetical protein
MAGGQRLISWLHPCSTSNVALNTRTSAHGLLMGHPNWAGCDSARRRVVATHVYMDVSIEFPAVGDGDASLQHPRCGALVQLAVDHGKGLGFPGDAPSLGPIRGEAPRSIQARYLAPNPSRGGGGVSISMASASPASYPSSKESTIASFEGPSSKGFTPARLEGAPEGSP